MCPPARTVSRGLCGLDSAAGLPISAHLMAKLLFPKTAVPCGVPADLSFQICTSSDTPPDGDGWLHQIKHDGWRVFVIVEPEGDLHVQSRNGYDMTDQFAMPVKGLAALGRTMILDGEIAVPDTDGRTHLDWLHEARTRHHPDRLALFAFDLVYFDGFDLRRCPLEERIAILDQLIAEAGCPRALTVGSVIGGGAEFFAKARAAGAEGIVSKRLGKRYIAGQSPHWLKTKANQTGRFLVTGYETELGRLPQEDSKSATSASSSSAMRRNSMATSGVCSAIFRSSAAATRTNRSASELNSLIYGSHPCHAR
jgi:bifunctional non-homologous end joining protein LigD